MKDSQGSGYRILCPRACARCPAGFIAKLFGPVSRQASWSEHHLSPTRHRHGGVFGVFHAEPVVPRSSAAVRGGPWAIQLRESVRHTEDPSDNHIRDMLDPASPTLLYPAFAEAVTQLGRIEGGLDVFRRLDGSVLIALDGTEYHCSRNIHCSQCSTRLRGKGDPEYYHAMLAATLVAPGHDKVIPLEPEFIVPQDGAEKQDCENMAAKRWLAAHGRRYAALDAIYLGDDLFSRQPLCQAVREVDGHFIFVCKPSSHPLIEEYLTGIDLPTFEETIKRGKQARPTAIAGCTTCRYGPAMMRSRSTGLRSRSATPRARRPIAIASSPICRSTAKTSLNSQPAAGRGGRSRTKPSTFSQGLQPRTQLRPWKTKPRGRSGRLEPARLRNPYRLRHWRRSLACRTGKAWTTLQLLQQAGGDHRIPDLPLLGRFASHARLRQATTTPAVIVEPPS